MWPLWITPEVKTPTWIKNSQDEQKTQRIRPNDAVALNLAQLDAFASHSRFLPHASQISQIYHKYLKMSRSDDLRSGRRNTSLVVPHCISPWAITVALWVIEFLDAKMQRSFVQNVKILTPPQSVNKKMTLTEFQLRFFASIEFLMVSSRRRSFFLWPNPNRNFSTQKNAASLIPWVPNRAVVAV